MTIISSPVLASSLGWSERIELSPSRSQRGVQATTPRPPWSTAGELNAVYFRLQRNASAVWLAVHGTGGRIRTYADAVLETAALPLSYADIWLQRPGSNHSHGGLDQAAIFYSANTSGTAFTESAPKADT